MIHIESSLSQNAMEGRCLCTGKQFLCGHLFLFFKQLNRDDILLHVVVLYFSNALHY